MRNIANLAVILAVLAFTTSPIRAANESPSPAADSVAVTPAPAKSLVPDFAYTERFLGKADAPVTITEYAMLTCPHCAELHTGPMIQIKKAYVDTGFVKIIYKDFPYDEVALKAAAVARCVPPEGYFNFIEALFMQQGMWVQASDPLGNIKKLAGFAGLDPAVFDACASDEKLLDYILQNRVEAANQYQINSTPTFVLEGGIEKMVGVQQFASYAQTIDRKLKEKGITPPKPAAAQ